MIRHIHDLHSECRKLGQPAVSVEFFPPKTDEGDRRLFEETIPALLEGNPLYCSVTYGAGGSTREKTLNIAERIQRDFGLTTVMHLTCVNSTQEQLKTVVEDARARGIKNLLALRGDPPGGTGDWTKTEGGFEYSAQLVRFLRELGGFSIGTAGFPEGHIAQTGGKHVDWGYLAEKVKAGAHFVVTQLFFDNTDYYEFRDFLSTKLGVDVPIVAGVLPVVSRNQTKKFTQLCGAKLPVPFLSKLEELGDDDSAVTEFGIEYCTRQCEDLLKNGVPGVHFYTLNKAHSTAAVIRNLGWTQPAPTKVSV
jgi:methylenetetrahydrofolate reductase (NADPH)